jgi:cytochrome oxidase assembly protein ShyY1
VATNDDYSFARRPVWLAGHVVALLAVIGFVLLGNWQLSRHDERRTLDVALDERLEVDVVGLDDLLAENADASLLEYRPVEVSGAYLSEDEVILQARSLNGRSGHEVLTPLLLDDGTAVIINRGWVPIDVEGPPVVGAEPLSKVATVTGYLRQTQVRSGLGPVDPGDGTLDRISRVDIDRLRQQIDVPLRAVWIQLAAQEPVQNNFPLVVDPPQPGTGTPHLSYAFQWFAFAAIVLIAYPFLMRRTARRSSMRTSPRPE